MAQDVLKTMLALGLNPVVEYTELEYSVDLALPQQQIAIEVCESITALRSEPYFTCWKASYLCTDAVIR